MNKLKQHPLLAAVVLFIPIFAVVAALSVFNGQHYSYRIANDGGAISQVKVWQKDESGAPLDLLTVESIGEDGKFTIIRLDSTAAGSGLLYVGYTRTNVQGEKIDVEEMTSFTVSRTGIVFVGEGTYNHSGFPLFYYGMAVYALVMMLYFYGRRRFLKEEKRYSYELMSTWTGQLFFLGIFMAYASAAAMSSVFYGELNVSLMSLVTSHLMMAISAMATPLVLVFAISMTISNVALMRHEGKSPMNMLGIAAGLLLLLGLVFLAVLFVLFLLYGSENLAIAVSYSVASGLYAVFLAVLGGSIISGVLAGTHNPAYNKDYIIILGCAIKKDGTLFPLIRGRVDRAIQFWNEQFDKTGKKAVFVPSGGQGSDEIIPEGEAMRRYLLEQGIPEELIMAETKSATTLENMKFSKELIDAVNPQAEVAFSTTNYHVMRGGILAGQAGLIAEGMGAKTKWYFWPNALLREVAGMFAVRPKLQLAVILVLAILAGLAGYAYYLVV